MSWTDSSVVWDHQGSRRWRRHLGDSAKGTTYIRALNGAGRCKIDWVSWRSTSEYNILGYSTLLKSHGTKWGWGTKLCSVAGRVCYLKHYFHGEKISILTTRHEMNSSGPSRNSASCTVVVREEGASFITGDASKDSWQYRCRVTRMIIYIITPGAPRYLSGSCCVPGLGGKPSPDGLSSTVQSWSPRAFQQEVGPTFIPQRRRWLWLHPLLLWLMTCIETFSNFHWRFCRQGWFHATGWVGKWCHII